MLKKLLIAVLTSKLAMTPAFADDESFGSGAGTKTCAEFAQAFRSNPKLVEDFFFTWAQGFMTGWNISADEVLHFDHTTISIDDQKTYIRDYCDARPLNLYVQAVIDLMGKLKYKDVQQ